MTDYCVHKYPFSVLHRTCVSFLQFVHIKSIFAPTFLNQQWSNPLVEHLSPATTQNMNNGVFLSPTCVNARHRRGQRSQCAFWWKDSAGGSAFIKQRRDLFYVLSHAGQREELVCADTRRLSPLQRFPFPWDILTCQHSAPRYRKREQFYLSECRGKSIPGNIGKPVCRPVSPAQGKSHFEKMVTCAINHSSAGQRPITFSSLN